MTNNQKSEVMKNEVDYCQIYLTGFNKENEEWILDVSEAALVGTNKVPNTKFILELCSMLGLPEPTLKEENPRTLLPIFIISGVIFSPAIMIALDENFLFKFYISNHILLKNLDFIVYFTHSVFRSKNYFISDKT